MKSHQNMQQQKATQICLDILNSRTMKATLTFKQFLTDHQQVIKKQEAKKEKLIGKGIKSRGGYSGGASKMKILPHHYQGEDRYSSTASSSMQSNSGDTLIMMGQDNSLQHRATSIQTIEKTLYDISTLFKRFANIVQEQQVLVDRIDQNTEQALYDLEGARKELRDVYEDTKSTRKLILKIFFILMLFSTFYILFVL
ncbi:qa-syp3 sed5p syntaxin 5-type [Stylonychia lemnae]|uniref:Qa-syp3 sed5p syntaxin 5-type n=1 Tax=Stylonychia lemnae TaxID=5949 RepID=A0A078B9P5_STYLE|nr:qa-syp3 sed5p syntaxin 5-type [Stylonychia lemnae]|eukprot:CDW90906.1 qa-syp3 sed5p syntaxin 5-type [Stylonychia lemnae]